MSEKLSELNLVRSICKQSFYFFIQEFWSVVVQADPIWNWHIKVLADELQKIAERVFKGEESLYDEVINIPPGTTKSTIVTVMFPAWVWTRMSHAQFICGSYAFTVAHNLGMKGKDVVDSEKYKLCFPEVGKLRADARAASMFINKHKGFRLSIGAGSATGFHGHFILIDDPIDPLAAQSPAERLTTENWMQSLSTRKVDKAVSVTILVMQRLNQADPSGIMLGHVAGKDWGTPVRHICLPWELSDRVSPIKLRAFYKQVDGKGPFLLDPVRLSARVCAAFRAKLGAYGFSGQFEQHPVPPEGGMFKTAMITFRKMPPHVKKTVRYWDKAGTALDGCYTVGVKMCLADDDSYGILNVVRGQWESNIRERTIRQTAEMDGRKITIGIEHEGGSGGKESAQNTVRKTLAGFHVLADHPTGDKQARADPFSTQVNDGNVWIMLNPDGSVPAWVQPYLDELGMFPLGQYADQVDASSGAFKLLTNKVKVGAAFSDQKSNFDYLKRVVVN